MLGFLLLIAAPDDAYLQGMTSFDQAEFAKAAPALKQALSGGKLSAAEQKKARFSLAQACFYNNEMSCAKNQVLKLIGMKLTFNPKLLPPDFVAFYNDVEEDAKAPPAPVAPKKKALPPVAKKDPIESVPTLRPSERATIMSQPLEVKATPTTLTSGTPWYLKVMPLGIGHFLQKDKVFGALFVTTEVALIAANVALAVVNEKRVQPNGRLPAGSQGLYWAQQGTAIASYAVLVLELIDSLLFAEKRAF